ncbi:MAG: phytoene/squalene synthase family protein [Pseudomonadota bacterium]
MNAIEHHTRPTAAAGRIRAPSDGPAAPDPEDVDYQRRILAQVSRTFALTIPQLPPRLRMVVGNAYLLCRIADTIEDDPGIAPAAKRALAADFLAAVAGRGDAAAFPARASLAVSSAMSAAERELLRESGRVMAILHTFAPAEREAVERCLAVMTEGMARFQERPAPRVRSHGDLADYRYVVAGCVGVMLTELFCAHSPEIAVHRDRLRGLAASFGQGLQMTNILKDVWEDRGRGQSWLPSAELAAEGVDIGRLEDALGSPGFRRAMLRLVSVALWHLDRALAYTLLIPPRETGIRRFCVWAVLMAVLTLRKICQRLDYQAGDEVKISRRAVQAVTVLAGSGAGSNRLLRLLFAAARAGLPGSVPDERARGAGHRSAAV